jgi:hypothetical protein
VAVDVSSVMPHAGIDGVDGNAYSNAYSNGTQFVDIRDCPPTAVNAFDLQEQDIRGCH